MSGMQDDKKLHDDLGTAHEVILVQSNTLVKQKVKIEELNYIRTKKSTPRKVAQDTFLAHLPREIVQVDIPEEFKKRIKSGDMTVIRESILESLKFIPPKLVVVEYREPVLAFANTPDQEIPVQGEANLGDKGRYHPSVAAQIVNGKFGLHQIKKGRCLGLDNTQVKLIMPKDLPDKAEGIEDPQIKRLIEKMIEAKKEKKDSLDDKGM
jgi:hypothetical protein